MQGAGESWMQLVIVDRDTLLEAGDSTVASPEHAWAIVPGSLEALSRLNGAGFRLVVTCNTPDLQRRNFSIENLNALHHRLQHALMEAGGSLDAVFFCSCLPKHECDCLMPNPGMLLDIAARLRVPLEDVAVIGGSEAAVDAARAAGARPILVDPAPGTTQSPSDGDDLARYPSMDAAVDDLLADRASV